MKYSGVSLNKRLVSLFACFVFISVLIVARLFVVQIIDGRELQAKALSQWYRDIPLSALRGSISDRNGVLLAESYTVYDVYVRPNAVSDMPAVISLLSSALQVERSEIEERVTGKNYSEILVATGARKEHVDIIVNGYQSGIYISENSERYYPYGDLLTQVLGFIDIDGNGQAGIEAYYNKYLKGIDGVSLVESDLKGKPVDSGLTYYLPSIPGLNIQLTIDFEIQLALESIILNAYHQTAAKKVTAVILDPSTGEIVASTSKPSFDLNDVPRDDILQLFELSKNHAVTDAYEPGSTFKVVTAAIALNEGLASEGSYFYCPGYMIVNGVRANCHRKSGHGSVSLAKGLSVSCNCVFMELANRIGIQKFYEYMEKLGVGSSGTGVDFSGENFGILVAKSQVKRHDLVRMGFGQSIALTPLCLANAVSAVVNGGNLLQPYYVKKITSSEGKAVYTRAEKIVKSKIFSDNVSVSMNKMLEAVVSSGGGKNAKIEGYSIGGKTGTAQKYDSGSIAQGKYVASFIGYAPANDPKYLVLVVVDEPKGSYYGGVTAAPVAKAILQKIIDIRGLEKDKEEVSEKEKFEMPNLIGKTLVQAVEILNLKGLYYEVEGEKGVVVDQIYPPGVMVSEGDICLIIMSE